LSPQKTANDPEQKKAEGEFAKASPEPEQSDTKIRQGVFQDFRTNNRRGDRNERTLLRWKNNQGIGIGVHAQSY